VTRYPIVAHYELDNTAKRARLWLGSRRDNSEIPEMEPHQVLVWQVGGQYILDTRGLRTSDNSVARASSVSVVSVRPSTEVGVSFEIDSEDAAKFTVKVTFICSVLEPIVVVRDGQVDAADALRAYLRGYQDLFAVGLEHPVREVNKVRTKMAIQIKSYMALRPPKIPGIEVTSATVQVETPVEVGKLRDISNEQQIELEKKKNGEAPIDKAWQSHLLDKAANFKEAVGSDPRNAIDLAYADGGMTSQEYANRVAQMDEAGQQREQMERLAAETRRQTVEDREAHWHHEREQTEMEWQHKKIENDRVEVREDRRNQVEANIELLKLLVDRGHLDTYNADIEDLIRRIRGGVNADSPRYLKGQYPDSVSVGKPFGLLASVVLMAGPSSAALKPFDVPQGGQDVRLEAHTPPGLRLLGHRLLTVHVPADGDSEPVMFELCTDEPGVRTVSVTAWIGGSYLGELRVDITAEHGHPTGQYRDVSTEITTESTEGAVSLVVRFDSRQNAYRFEFRDEDNPDEVTSNLAYEPGPRVEQLIASLEALAKGRSGHEADQVRTHLVNSGAALWHELIPKTLRDQFWERQDRIRQLTILADKDAVPWELLYPMDPGYDKGFLVEQFPVTRAIFGRQPARKLSLWPARFVLPEGSPPEARAEIDAMRMLLDPSQPSDEVISGPMPLQNLIAAGEFGLLHFACHNTYNPVGGSSIKLGNAPFTPTDISTAAINKVLASSAPTVFINACRSAGLNATYNRLDGWATKFLEAGAAAFIGSLWAVSDGGAREFAQELYGQLRAGSSLGHAVKCARAAACRPDDPTWLAYTVYGDPRATLVQNRSWSPD
jgi:hypothetical protein